MAIVVQFGGLRFSSWNEYRKATREKPFARLKTLLGPKLRDGDFLRVLVDASGASAVLLRKVREGTHDLRTAHGTQLRERLATLRGENETRTGGPDVIVRELIDTIDVARLLELPADEKAQIELLLTPPKPAPVPPPPVNWTVGQLVTVGETGKRGRKPRIRPSVTVIRARDGGADQVIAVPQGAIATGTIGNDGSLASLNTEFSG